MKGSKRKTPPPAVATVEPKAYQRLPAGAYYINVMVLMRLRSDRDQDLVAWFAALAPRQRARTVKAILRHTGLRIMGVQPPVKRDTE